MPRHWQRSIRSALVHVIALAHYALVCASGRAGRSSKQHLRQTTKTDQLEQEIALLREELRIKDARLERIPANRRPHYQPSERLAILELRAARGWSLAQTARIFQLTNATIASWNERLDEDGPAALVRTPVPVNKFPQFVAHIVQRLQALCPRLGKVKIAQILARAGLHLGATTVGRLRRRRARPQPPPTAAAPSARRVTARFPNHLWHVDLTVVPTSAGFWASWLPFALPQCWPFCWWLAVILDHYSRRALGFRLFLGQPSSEQMRHFLGQVMATVGAVRFILTLKDGCTRLLPVVPLLRRALHRELSWFFRWYNGSRPHMTLQGATPDEMYFARRPACRQPRFEPRPDWPRPAPCANPQVLVKGQPGAELELTVEFLAGRRHLPCVTISRAA